MASARAVRTDGAFVFRGSVPGGLLMIDFDRERTLLIGNTAAQLADICATGAAPEEVTEHDVFTPNGVLLVLIQAGTLPAVVYPVLSVDPCADLLGVTPLAEGTAHGIYTDNDNLLTSKGRVLVCSSQADKLEEAWRTPSLLDALSGLRPTAAPATRGRSALRAPRTSR